MPRSFDNGSWTSEIAKEMAEGFKGRVIKEIHDYLSSRKNLGSTDQELERALQRPGNTIRPGRVNLVKSGHVVYSGGWRYTEANRPAKVWVLCQFASETK
jgi:hypothetical protein